MNKKYIYLAALLLTSYAHGRFVIDTIKAVVYGEDKDDVAIITMSDITRPGIDGAVHSLDGRIFEKLLWFDGKKHRILPSDEDIDRHLKMVERENNIGRKELIGIFKAGGYTFEEGKEQFGVMYTVNAMIDFKVRGGLFVSQKEVRAYYDDNPEYVDATYTLQRGLIPYNYQQTQQEQMQSINQARAQSKPILGLSWSPAFALKQEEMAADKAFIQTMQPGAISEPVPVAGGFEVFKLVSVTPRRLRTFDERYGQIADLLRRPKYQEILKNYKKQLYDNASVVYF